IVASFYSSVLCCILNKQLLQNDADQLSLRLALILNKEDRSGRMNALEADCREQLYDTRETLRSVSRYRPGLVPICRRLEDEARRSITFVEDERHKLITDTIDELKSECDKGQRELQSRTGFRLLCFSATKSIVQSCALGKIADSESSVVPNHQNLEIY